MEAARDRARMEAAEAEKHLDLHLSGMSRVTGIDFTPRIGPRRPGDPDRIVATGELAARDLDWANRYTVDEMVRTGWEARRAAH